MKKKILVSLLCLTVVISGLVGCTAKEETAPKETTNTVDPGSVEGSLEGVTLKVGTSGLFGPFSYYDTDGTTLIGYDIDLLVALQDILGFEIDNEIEAMSYSALTTSVTEGKLDLAAAALCATDERKVVMDFSQTYCDSGQQVMVNSSDDKGISSVDDLAGKTIAVEKGTASHYYAENNLPDTTLEVHDTITTAYESLEQSKVDALIQDGPGCAFYVKTTDSTALEVVGEEFNQGQAPYAIAFVKDSEYVDAFDAALTILEENGILDALYEKWCK